MSLLPTLHRGAPLVAALFLSTSPVGAQALQSGQVAFDILGFEGLPAGAHAEALFGRFGTGPVLVNGVNPALAGENAALIFDSGTPTGGDFDLGAPNEDFGGPGIGDGGGAGGAFPNDQPRGGVIIVGDNLEDGDGDGLVDNPGDSSLAGTALEFDFSELGGVRPVSIGVLDLEDRPSPAVLRMFGEDGSLLDEIQLVVVGNNGHTQVGLGATEGVYRIVVDLGGSGALDDLVFAPSLDASVGGFLWRDLDRDGFQEDGEPGLEGIVLDLFLGSGAPGPLLSVVTGPDGSYLMPEVPPGEYILSVDETSLPPGIQPTLCNASPGDGFDSECSPLALTLTPGQAQVASFGYTYATDLVLGDFCFVDINRNGIQDDDDFGVEGVLLSLYDEAGVLLDAQSTGPNGEYLFTNLQPGTYTIVPNASNALTGNLGPAICNVGADGSIDSDCGPVCVTLVPNQPLGVGLSNSTIDFGYSFCGDCEGGVDALSLKYPGTEPVFVEVLQQQGQVVFSDVVEPDQVFSFFGQGAMGVFGPTLRVFVDNQEVAEVDTTCAQPIFLGLHVGPFEVVAGSSLNGGAFCKFIELDVIDFDGVPAGTLLTSTVARGGSGPIGVEGFQSGFPGQNVALEFDSSFPTGGDLDLGSPHVDFGGPGVGAGGGSGSPFANFEARDGVLIVADNLIDGDGDGLVDNPGDTASASAQLVLDFSEIGGVRLLSCGLLDIDARPQPAVVHMFAANGAPLGQVVAPITGDNGFTQLDLGGVAGVYSMVVDLRGSGALDDVVFERQVPGMIGGLLWSDLDQDGFRELGEPALGGVTLHLYRDTSGLPLTSVVTGARGTYLLENVPAGDYRLEVDMATLPPGAVPTLCNSSPGDGFDSECSPLELTVEAHQFVLASFGFIL